MLLLLFAGATEPEPPEPEQFFAVGGKGVRRPAGRGAAGMAGDAAAMEMLIAQRRDEQDLREAQDIVAALFAFKGIF